MKSLYLLCFYLFTVTQTFSQTLNYVTTDKSDKPMLLGKVTKQGLTQKPFSEWFNKNQEEYLVNDKIVEQLKDSLSNYTIKAFFGSWCGDSKRELPHFYKILEQANFPTESLEVYALHNSKELYKQGANGEEKAMKIHRVPTFIFYKDGTEVNRIVEHPRATLERDILNIVSDKRYSPNYVVANYMQNLLEEKPLDTLQQDTQNLAIMLAEYAEGSKELNTLGYVYLRAKQLDKALFIFKLNTKLFPNNLNVYDSLAEAYVEAENYTEALKNYYKVLSINPENENAIKQVKHIQSLLKPKTEN